jgi:hypothetical protein
MDSKTDAAMNAVPPSDQASPNGMIPHDAVHRKGDDTWASPPRPMLARDAALPFKHRAAELAHRVAA